MSTVRSGSYSVNGFYVSIRAASGGFPVIWISGHCLQIDPHLRFTFQCDFVHVINFIYIV